MNPDNMRKMFLVAAIFNWIVGLGLLFAPNAFLGLAFVTPAIDNPTWAGLFGWLVTCFGLAYYWISRDPAGNRQLILLGIIGKFGVVAVALAHVLAGNISWQIMISAAVDGIFAVLFIMALGAIAKVPSASEK